MGMTTISLRLEDKDAELIKEYAAMKRITVSELIRQTIMDRIAGEVDLRVYRRAAAEYRRDPQTCTHEEAGALLEKTP